MALGRWVDGGVAVVGGRVGGCCAARIGRGGVVVVESGRSGGAGSLVEGGVDAVCVVRG